MALVVMSVMTAMLTSVVLLTTANFRDAQRSSNATKAYTLAEAGLNNALAVLNGSYPGSSVGYPGDANLLPTRTSTYGNGTTTWSGSLVPVTGQQWAYEWHLSSTGSMPNPTGPTGTLLRRTVTATVPVILPPNQQQNGSSPLNWIYAGGNVVFSQSLQVASPVYSVGDLSLANSAKILGSAGKIGVGGNLYQSTVQNQVGLTGGSDPRISEAHVVGRCSVKGNVLLHDCGGTPTSTNWDPDFVFASSTNHSLAGLLSYTPSLTCCATSSDMGFWYTNADIGPNHACTTGSVPFSLDTGDGVINNSSTPTTPVNLTPSTSSYSCLTSSGSISWNNSTKALTVNGTVFIDGSATIDSTGYSGNPVFTYSGIGTIVLSGTFAMKGAKICAVVSGSDCNWNTSAWNPNGAALAIVADGDGGNGGAQSQANVVGAGYGIELVGSSSFQGALLAAKSITTAQTAQEEGPMISVYSNVEAGQSGTLTFPSINFGPTAASQIATGQLPTGQVLLPRNWGA